LEYLALGGEIHRLRAADPVAFEPEPDCRLTMLVRALVQISRSSFGIMNQLRPVQLLHRTIFSACEPRKESRALFQGI
jgi:hypothetical protein